LRQAGSLSYVQTRHGIRIENREPFLRLEINLRGVQPFRFVRAMRPDDELLDEEELDELELEEDELLLDEEELELLLEEDDELLELAAPGKVTLPDARMAPACVFMKSMPSVYTSLV